jgi:iron complex outermembrane recepter protein
MTRFTLVLTAIILVCTAQINGQNKSDANVFGHVINSSNREHIPFINVLIQGSRIGTITDGTGHYILTNIPEGKHVLIVTGMEYETKTIEFEIKSNQSKEIDVEVNFVGVNLDAIVITSSPTSSGFRYQPDQTFIGEDLQKRSEVSFGEMLNNSPGISMRSLGSSPSRPVIRGMDGDRILILENGERMGDISETSADHSIALDPLVANRVEIVRGPASLLYGSSALGGVINLMTTDIPDRWDAGSHGVLSMQGATMNKMGAGFARYTYGSDNWAATGRIAHRQSSNITTPDGVLPGTSINNTDAAFGFGFNSKSNMGGLSFSLADQKYEIPEFIDDPDMGVEIRMKRYALQGRLNFERTGFFDKGLVRFNLSQMTQQEVEFEIVDNVQNEEIELEYSKHAYSTSLTLQHKPFAFFARGAMGFNFHGHQLKINGISTYTPGELRSTFGAFTFQEIPLSDKMRLQFGIRLDLQHSSAIPTESFNNISSSRNTLNHSGSIGFNHRPTTNIEVGGQFARSHRNPSIEELYANGIHLGAGVYEIGNSMLKDEVGQGIDLFIRWNKKYFDVEVASFANHFRNYIIFEPTGNVDPSSNYPIFQYSGDEARLIGIEISGTIKPTEMISIGLGTDYVDGRRIQNGKEYLPFIPPLRFMADFEFDFKTGWIGAKAVNVAKQDRVAPEESITNGYTLIGLSAGYRIKKFGNHVIIFRIDNLLNTKYRDHLSRIEDRNFPMPGRNTTVAYRWFF